MADGPIARESLQDRVMLELDKVGTRMMLPIGLQRVDARVDMEGFVAGELVASLTAYVLSEHLASDTESTAVDVPATWVDHAKDALQEWVESDTGGRARRLVQRAADRPVAWMLRRSPIEWRKITLSVTWHRAATRPHSTLHVPQLGPVIYQERTERWGR